MQKEILAELKAVVILAGTQELPVSKQLSPTVLNKAAKEFKNWAERVSPGYRNTIYTIFLRLRVMALVNIYARN